MEILGVLWAMLAGAAVGAYFSRSRERDPVLGAALGFILGPIGWLIELLANDPRPTCEECGGRTVLNAQRCRNCGAELIPSEPPPHSRRLKASPPPMPVAHRSANAEYTERY
jgi:hypothetical protein